MSESLTDFDTWPTQIASARIPANNNVRRMEVLTGPVISATTTAQPVSPNERDIYIIPSGATGSAWVGFDEGDIAIFYENTWTSFAPFDGLRKFVEDEGEDWQYIGSSSGGWGPAGSGGGTGTVTSVDASGGVQTASGSAITATGTIRGAHVINAQTGTSYAILAADRGKHLTLSNAASIAATIAEAGTTGFEDGFFVFFEVVGAGAVTITPTTSTINGAASLVLDSGMSGILFSDGTNYRVMLLDAAGITVNPQTGTTYTYLSGDRGKLVSHTNGSAIAGTLPQATGAFGAGWFMYVQNRGAGTLTITPTTSTIDGAASLALTTGLGVLIASDGTNYYTMRGAASGGGGGGLTNWTDAFSSATQATSSLVATNAATNVNAALVAKGNGATVAQVPDGTTAGGNSRGTGATDWQKTRSAASQVASGNNSTLSGGRQNSVQGADGFVGGGFNNTQNQQYGVVCGGQSNTGGDQSFVGGGTSNDVASSQYGAIAGGQSNQLSGAASWIPGGRQATDRGIANTGAWSAGQFSVKGDAQVQEFVLRSDTTNATPEAMTTDNAAAATTNTVTLPNNSAYDVTGRIVARDTSGNAQTWEVNAMIVRGANAAATVLVVGGTPAVKGTNGTFTGTIALTANTTIGGLAVTVTGVAATNIKWVASLRAVEVVG